MGEVGQVLEDQQGVAYGQQLRQLLVALRRDTFSSMITGTPDFVWAARCTMRPRAQCPACADVCLQGAPQWHEKAALGQPRIRSLQIS